MSGLKFFVIVGIVGVMIATLFKVYQDQNRESLYTAVSVSDSAKVIRMLASGVEPTHRNVVGSTVLMQAASLKNTDILTALIEYGVEVDAVDMFGNTALFNAVTQDNITAIDLLLKAGADVNHLNKKGLAPIHLAIEQSHVAATRHLLRNKANTQIKGPNGESLESLARARSKREVFIELEASLHDWQPIHRAAALGDYLGVMRLVDSGVDIEVRTKQNLTPLALAVQGEHTTVIEFLFDHGAKYNLDNDNGEWLLNVARKGEDQETAIMIESRIDGWSKLMEAAALNDISKLELYVNKKDDIDRRSRFDRTALMVAINHGNLESVQSLLQHGAKVNVQDKFGWSPLMYASHLGHKDITQYLLKHNARIDYFDDYCNSAFKLSVDRIGRNRMVSSMYSVSDDKQVSIDKHLEKDPVLSMLRKAGNASKTKSCEPKRTAKTIGEMVSTNNWLARTPIAIQSSL